MTIATGQADEPTLETLPRIGRATRPGVLRSGAGDPLLLLHGITGSAGMWRRVMPRLSPYHDVIAMTALGHRGGLRAEVRPARIAHIVDDAERCLDEFGIDRAHLAGNSMGGWVALELARRGRARSVCALSPAGLWQTHDPYSADKLRRAARMARMWRPLMPVLARLAPIRREALRDNAYRGERVSPHELVELIDDMLGCAVRDDLFSTNEKLEALEPTCPITVAWAEYDRIFPVAAYTPRAHLLLPSAHHIVLDGVGHVPMFDDPQLVADTILAAVARSNS